MNGRLIDASRPFEIIYALYHHEYLGCLISPHAVGIMPSGDLSYAYQRLHPESMEPFAHKMDEVDKQLIKLTAEINPKRIIKKFRGNPREEHQFFTEKFKGEVATMAVAQVQRRMAEILPLLAEKLIYLEANDGYPAHKKVTFIKEKAQIQFHFLQYDKEGNQYPDHFRYFPTIKIGEQPLKFINKGAILPCENPAWMLVEEKLLTFARDVEGKKLKPFLKKPFISVPLRQKDVYFKTFVPQLIEQYYVRSQCFGIRTIQEQPIFSLKVEELDNEYYTFKPKVSYGDFTLNLQDATRAKAIMTREEEKYVFYKVKRNVKAESGLRDLLDGIKPNPTSLTPWDYIPREEGLAWLAKHAEDLTGRGVQIKQSEKHTAINLRQPKLEMETSEEGDWFDIKAIVRIGEYRIPFIKFRKHILSGKREYRLPDGSICILPEHWFSDFRHLLEVSEDKQDDTLRIRKYQAPLLNLPSSKNGEEVNMMIILNGKNNLPIIDPPKGLKAELRSYQQEGLSWLTFLQKHGIGGILADDMGLGKTLQTISLLLLEKEKGVEVPSLAVLPTSLLHNWLNEAKKFAPSMKVKIHAGINRTKDLAHFSDYDLILTTYGIVRQDLDELVQFPFHYLILDESQTIKNPSSKTAKAIKKLVAHHRLSLTGTPIENTVMDIWSQMSFLNPGLLGNENFFKKFYVQPIEKGKDPARIAKLRRIIYPFILRRRKRQVEKELPPKIERLHYCGMDEHQEKLYEETRNQYRNYLLELVNSGTYKRNKLNLLAGLQKLRQIAIHPKLVEHDKYELEQSGKYLEIKRMIDEVISKKSKVLVFSQFVKTLQLLKNDFEKEGIAFNYLDGSTKDRNKEVDSFQNDSNIPVFLISLKAGGVGLNLTAADYVFILDPWWNPAVENQAIDRSHRIGQKKTVFYYKFITEDTIEEKILDLQKRKAKLSDDIISIEDDIYKGMTEEDFAAFLN